MHTTARPFFDTRRFLMTGSIVLASLAAYRFFPGDNRLSGSFQSMMLGVAFFLLLPIMYQAFVAKRPLSDMGFSGSTRKLGFLVVPLAVLPIVSVWYLLLKTYPVTETYSLSSLVAGSFSAFLLYEAVLVGTITFLYEVFFRGLVMLSWLSPFGIVSVLVQSIVLALFMASYGPLDWGHVPMLLASLSGGFAAYYTRSLYYSWFSAWLVLFLADSLVLLFS